MIIINKRIEAFVIDILASIIMSSCFFIISVLLNNSMLWMSFALALIYSFLFCKDVNGGRSIGPICLAYCIYMSSVLHLYIQHPASIYPALSIYMPKS